MKQKIQKILVGFMAFMIFISFSVPVQAKTYDVTKKTKKEINTMLNDTVEFLVLYACHNNKPGKLKLTNRQKTNLVCFATRNFSEHQMHATYKNGDFVYKFTASKSQIRKQLKHLFGNKAKFDLGNSAGKKVKKDITNLYWKKGNAIYQYVGEWGDSRPIGKVSKVYQLSDGTYKVKYITYFESSEGTSKVAEYSIRLKANKKSKYGYNINRIDLVKNYYSH